MQLSITIVSLMLVQRFTYKFYSCVWYEINKNSNKILGTKPEARIGIYLDLEETILTTA